MSDEKRSYVYIIGPEVENNHRVENNHERQKDLKELTPPYKGHFPNYQKELTNGPPRVQPYCLSLKYEAIHYYKYTL